MFYLLLWRQRRISPVNSSSAVWFGQIVNDCRVGIAFVYRYVKHHRVNWSI